VSDSEDIMGAPIFLAASDTALAEWPTPEAVTAAAELLTLIGELALAVNGGLDFDMRLSIFFESIADVASGLLT